MPNAEAFPLVTDLHGSTPNSPCINVSKTIFANQIRQEMTRVCNVVDPKPQTPQTISRHFSLCSHTRNPSDPQNRDASLTAIMTLRLQPSR